MGFNLKCSANEKCDLILTIDFNVICCYLFVKLHYIFQIIIKLTDVKGNSQFVFNQFVLAILK